MDYDNINELKIGSILTYVNLAISCIIPFFYTPVMLRLLGQSEYGLYGLSNSVVSYLTLLTFGMGTAVNRYTIEAKIENNHEKLENTVGLFLILYLFFAGLTLIAGFLLSWKAGLFFGRGLDTNEIARLKILIRIMTCSTALSLIASVFSTMLIVYEKYLFRKLLDCVATLAAPILNLIILFAGKGSVGMAVAGFLTQIFYLLIFFIYNIKKLNIRPRVRNLPIYMLKDIWGYSLYMFISAIVDMLYWATDKVLLGALVGTTAVAIYNIGGTFNGMLQQLSAAISSVFGTRVTTMVLSERSMDDISELLIRVGRLQYLIVAFFLSGYVVFGKTFILFWAGAEYGQAFYVGLLTLFPLAVPLIQNIAFTTIMAEKKHRFRSILYLIIALFNVVSTALVIPRFGLIGAAVCTCLAFVIGQGFIMNIFYYKEIGLDIPAFWKNILQMSVMPALVSTLSLALIYLFPIRGMVQFLIYVILFMSIYLCVLWFAVMNDYEKTVIKELVEKTLKIIRLRKR